MKRLKQILTEDKYTQKQPWALVDTSANNKIIATASDETGVKRSISSAHLPPLRVKDKSTLKIVKMKKPQQAGEMLKSDNLVESKDTLKIGDKIRTKLGGQTPGIITKIEGDKIYFDHATAKYDTVWSGAKGKPKQYVAHRSNVVKEEINEAFSKDQLAVLKKEYGTLQKMDVTSNSYKKLIALLNNLPQSHLKSLVDADIKFVSKLAKNRLKEETEIDERCWDGYKPTPGKKPYEKGSCMKENDKISEAASGPTRMELQKHFEKTPGSKAQKLASVEKTFRVKNIVLNSKQQIVNFDLNESYDDLQEEAEHEGKKVTLNKPFRTPDGPKKFAVYVKNDKGNVVKVTFGDPNMEIKRDNPERRKNYRARHNCSDPGPKWKANYWSCKMWADKPVSKMTEAKTTFDFVELDGPKTKRVVGGITSISGESPESALTNRFKSMGYQDIVVTNTNDVIMVSASHGNSKEKNYYKLKKSISEVISSDSK
jgi:hypothetical protein